MPRSHPEPGLFCVLTVILSNNGSPSPAMARYQAIKQDVFVDMTGRFELIQETDAVDKKTCDLVRTVEYIDNEPDGSEIVSNDFREPSGYGDGN